MTLKLPNNKTDSISTWEESSPVPTRNGGADTRSRHFFGEEMTRSFGDLLLLASSEHHQQSRCMHHPQQQATCSKRRSRREAASKLIDDALALVEDEEADDVPSSFSQQWQCEIGRALYYHPPPAREHCIAKCKTLHCCCLACQSTAGVAVILPWVPNNDYKPYVP
jgi:hypothetical protein